GAEEGRLPQPAQPVGEVLAKAVHAGGEANSVPCPHRPRPLHGRNLAGDGRGAVSACGTAAFQGRTAGVACAGFSPASQSMVNSTRRILLTLAFLSCTSTRRP